MVEQLRGMNTPIYQIDDAGWYTEPELWAMTKVEFQCAMTEHGGFREVMKLVEQHGVILDFRNDPYFQEQEENVKFVPVAGQVALVLGDERRASEIMREIHQAMRMRRETPLLMPDVSVQDRADVTKWLDDVANIRVMKPNEMQERLSYLPEAELPSTRAQRRHGHRARSKGKGPQKEWWNA